MQIIELNINDLTPYANNPRKNDGAVDKVAASIKEFGFKVPIVIDKDKVVVCGHTRLKAAKKLKFETVPCIVADDLTEDQIKAFRLADNKVSELAEWDFDLLEQELANLELDMSMFDFEIKEEEPAEVVEDEVPEDVETRCKRGDIWRLGDHRLMCGDSTSIDDVERLMGGQKADMVFTDPPYGMYLDTDFSSMKSKLFKGKTGGAEYSEVIGDNADFKPELITTIFNNFDYCKEIFTWGADYYAELLPNKNAGSWVVWDKRLDDSADKMYGSCFELCWSKNKHKRDIARIKWAGLFGMEKEFDKKRQHPTQKPTALVQWFLDRFSKENQSIVDLYGGSGSTLIACEQLNRKCYTMEWDEHYCDVIIQRWENLTGNKAERIEQ